MNKKFVLIVGVILLLALGAYLFMRKGVNPSAPSSNTPTSNSQSSGSLKDLISKGIAQTCTYSNENGKGTFYVSGGKTRGDFESTVGSVTTKGHMLIDSGTSYIWMDGQKTGFKSTIDTSATTQPSAKTNTTQNFDVNADINYNCTPGVSDSSLFSLPKDVQFMSYSVPTSTTGSNSNPSQCSYCNNLTGNDKTQCLSALKCK